MFERVTVTISLTMHPARQPVPNWTQLSILWNASHMHSITRPRSTEYTQCTWLTVQSLYRNSICAARILANDSSVAKTTVTGLTAWYCKKVIPSISSRSGGNVGPRRCPLALRRFVVWHFGLRSLTTHEDIHRDVAPALAGTLNKYALIQCDN